MRKRAACSSTPLSSVRRNIENMKAHLSKEVFNGHISDMVSAFVDSDELSADDIKELQDILNVKGTGRK